MNNNLIIENNENLDLSSNNDQLLQTEIAENNDNDNRIYQRILNDKYYIRLIAFISFLSLILNIIILCIQLLYNVQIANSKFNSYNALFVTKNVVYIALSNLFSFLILLFTSKTFKFLIIVNFY